MYDVIVLGGGPGGYFAAEQAGAAKLKTIIIEERALGGVCLNEGCIPTKTLLNSAKMFEHAKYGEAYGVYSDNARLDHKGVVARKNKVVKTLVSGVGATMKKNGVEVVAATGKILGKDASGMIRVEAAGKVYEGKNLIIATGSEAVVPPIPGLRENVASGYCITSREALDLETLPSTLTVIGGGVIGLEMASYFAIAGVKVTVVEMLTSIGGPIDEDISKLLLKNLSAKGVEFALGAKVTSVSNGSITYEKDGKVTELKSDKTLVCIGRRARTAGIGLETLGVLTKRGAIVCDNHTRTNVSGVYAVGDVNGRVMLAHTAYREADVAVKMILGKKDIVRYNSIPSAIYTYPEVGAVGLTEKVAKAAGIEVKSVVVPMMFSGRFIAETNGEAGIAKVICDKKHGNIIGVHLLSPYASEIIYGGALMVEMELKPSDVRELVFPHPTMAEILREAVFQLDEV